MSTAVQGELGDNQRRSMLVRAVIASTIGTSIEWYDFFLYSVVTGLVFAKTFFPDADPHVGLLNSFGIYFGGFAARPIGARAATAPLAPMLGLERAAWLIALALPLKNVPPATIAVSAAAASTSDMARKLCRKKLRLRGTR